MAGLGGKIADLQMGKRVKRAVALIEPRLCAAEQERTRWQPQRRIQFAPLVMSIAAGEEESNIINLIFSGICEKRAFALRRNTSYEAIMCHSEFLNPRVVRKIAILGGSGFVGKRLVPLLSSTGIEFRIGDIARASHFQECWAYCDVRDRSSLLPVVCGADTILNLAAEHRDDVRPVSRYYETNVKGAEEVCATATENGIKRILFTSSVAVYGLQRRPVDERGPFEPFNAYGETKLQAEQVYRAWALEDSSRTLVIIRPTVIFGEGNRGNVYNLLRQVASGRFFMVGNGENRKSMAYVGNVAAFLVHCLTFGHGIHMMNYVDQPDMCTRELVDKVRAYMGRTGRIHALPKTIVMAGGRTLDVIARMSGRTFPISAVRIEKFCASTEYRANLAFESGFTPPFTLEDGLARTIRSEFSHASVYASTVSGLAE